MQNLKVCSEELINKVLTAATKVLAELGPGLLELKAVNNFTPIHLAQVMTYLKVLNIKRGFLLNFNTRLLKHGIKRVSI